MLPGPHREDLSYFEVYRAVTPLVGNWCCHGNRFVPHLLGRVVLMSAP